MKPAIETRAEQLVKQLCAAPSGDRMNYIALEHLRAVERAATKAAYERAANSVEAIGLRGGEDYTSGYSDALIDGADVIRALALADGGSDE